MLQAVWSRFTRLYLRFIATMYEYNKYRIKVKNDTIPINDRRSREVDCTICECDSNITYYWRITIAHNEVAITHSSDNNYSPNCVTTHGCDTHSVIRSDTHWRTVEYSNTLNLTLHYLTHCLSRWRRPVL